MERGLMAASGMKNEKRLLFASLSPEVLPPMCPQIVVLHGGNISGEGTPALQKENVGRVSRPVHVGAKPCFMPCL
jgi:hypothetical protein